MKIGVIGAGTMGVGIVQVAITSGDTVLFYDIQKEQLEKSIAFLKKMLQRQVEKGKLHEKEKNGMLQRIAIIDDLNGFAECDMIIEAVVEDIAVKQQLFLNLESIVTQDCILSSNTSSLSISSLAGKLHNPHRMLGIHFFNPAPLMPLVEIIPTQLTATDTLSTAKACVLRWGKQPVIAKDTPGFIVNRIARPFYGESLRIYEEGIADFPTIDWAMKKYGGFKMGPFELTDLIGQDINNAVSEVIFQAMYFDRRYKPSIVQKRMVELNILGRKTEKGFYTYVNGKMQGVDTIKDEELGKKIFERVLVMLINEAVEALYLKIASREDIDLAITKGLNYPRGLLQWCDEFGVEKTFTLLKSLHDDYCEERYRPSLLLMQKAVSNQSFY